MGEVLVLVKPVRSSFLPSECRMAAKFQLAGAAYQSFSVLLDLVLTFFF